MTEEQTPEYTKEELYAHAKEHNMFVCGDPSCIDEDNKVDYSHVSFLEETEQITASDASCLHRIWSVLWPTIENFMQKLVMSGEDAKDLQAENRDWKNSYAEMATELRILRSFALKSPLHRARFNKYRLKELKKLEGAMAETVKQYQLGKVNEKTIKED